MKWSVRLTPDDQWDRMYKLAKAYYDTHGDLLIPQRFNTTNGIDKDINGNNLGQWINTQRQRYKNSSLSQDRIEKLEAIGMIWNILDYQWIKMYELAKAYYETYGNLLISKGFNTKNGINKDINSSDLGQWIIKQRQKYRKGSLSQDKIEKLELIGMVWNVRKNKSEINELCEQHGINQKNNKNIISHISFREFEAKINYLLDMKSPIYDDEGRLHEIFYMSNPDMEEKYGTNLEELINKYYHTRERK